MSTKQRPGTRERRRPADRFTPATPLRIAVELAVAFALLAAIDRLYLGGTAFVTVQPHPYWVPVLLGAILYGTGAGLAAAAVASLLWVMLAPLPFLPGQDYFVHVLAIAKLPLLWAFTALGLGEIALFRERRLVTTIRREAKYVSQVDILSRRYGRLNRLNQQLQTRIVTETRTIPNVVAQAVALADAPDGAVGDLIALLSGTSDFTLSRLVDGRPLPIVAPADPRPAPPPALIAALAMRTAPIHVGTPDDRALLGDAGLCALPVRCGRHGPVLGLLLFHALPADRLTDAGIADIAGIAEWLDPVAARRWPLAPPAAA